MNQPSNVRLLTESRVGPGKLIPSQDQLEQKLSKDEADTIYATLWKPSTSYQAGAIALHPTTGVSITRIGAGTSRPSFDATEQSTWTVTAATPADLPLYPVGSVKAGRVPRPGTVDIRDYITTGNTFDLAAVVAAMERGSGACYIPPGNWVPNAFNVGLDDSALPAGTNYAADRYRFVYKFFGAGKQSRLVLPTGMQVGDYLMIANSAVNADLAFAPKIQCEDFCVSGAVVGGTSSPNGSFMKLNARNLSAERVMFSSMYNGFYTTGYCDLISFSKVTSQTMTPGGYILVATANGDSWTFDQVMAYGGGALNISGSGGIQVRGGISGFYKFTYCGVTFTDCHIEGDGSTDATPIIQLIGTKAVIASGEYYCTKYRPFIQIDDSSISQYGATNLTIEEGVRWFQRLDSPGSERGSIAGVALNIVNLSKRGEVHFVRPTAFHYPQKEGQPGDVVQGVFGIKVTSSDSDIQALLSLKQSPVLYSSDYVLRWLDNAWRLMPAAPSSAWSISTKRISSQTYLSVSVNNSQMTWSTTLPSGTYYYKAYVIDSVGRNSAPSSEVTCTTTADNPFPQIVVNSYASPCVLRIYRGTTPGTYTHYAAVVLQRDLVYLCDQGDSIAGVAWSNSSLPAIPGNGANTTANGLFLPFIGRSVIYQSSIPTVGDWVVGDICWNISPTPGGPAGWMCTARRATPAPGRRWLRSHRSRRTIRRHVIPAHNSKYIHVSKEI